MENALQALSSVGRLLLRFMQKNCISFQKRFVFHFIEVPVYLYTFLFIFFSKTIYKYNKCVVQ